MQLCAPATTHNTAKFGSLWRFVRILQCCVLHLGRIMNQKLRSGRSCTHHRPVWWLRCVDMKIFNQPSCELTNTVLSWWYTSWPWCCTSWHDDTHHDHDDTHHGMMMHIMIIMISLHIMAWWHIIVIMNKIIHNVGGWIASAPPAVRSLCYRSWPWCVYHHGHDLYHHGHDDTHHDHHVNIMAHQDFCGGGWVWRVSIWMDQRHVCDFSYHLRLLFYMHRSTCLFLALLYTAGFRSICRGNGTNDIYCPKNRKL